MNEHWSDCKLNGYDTGDEVKHPPDGISYDGPCDCGKDDNDLIEAAWGIIANAYGGNWYDASRDWQDAAKRWRSKYHSRLRNDIGRKKET